MIQIHAAPARANRGIIIAHLYSRTKGVIGPAKVTGRPQAFGHHRRIGRTRQALVARRSPSVALVLRCGALSRFGGLAALRLSAWRLRKALRLPKAWGLYKA